MRVRRALVAGLALTTTFTPITAADAVDNRIIDIVSVSWAGASAPEVTVADIEKTVVRDVAPLWKKFTQSIGELSDVSISFLPGKIITEPMTLSRPMACEGVSSQTFMSTIQRDFYRKYGVADFSRRYLLILTPDAGCIWQGRALLGDVSSPGGVVALHNTSSSFVITHELGHTLGLGHSNLLKCSSGARDGAWGKECKSIEYGGTIDVMGNVDTTSPLSTYHQWRIGLIGNESIHQSWIDENISLTASDVAGKTRAIFIRDGNATYWIEYRRGTDTHKPGLAIYRTDPPPISAIESLNPADTMGDEYGLGVTSDLWMLNWDDYSYTTNRTSARGSMTLPEGRTATVLSGRLSISAKSTEDDQVISVSINRAADITPPPTQAVLSQKLWRSGDTNILKSGREDQHTSIDYFEIRTGGKVSRIRHSHPDEWTPSFLNPLTPSPTIRVKDLPGGRYRFSIRAIDKWGNISPWSKSVDTNIDRIPPTATNSFEVEKIVAGRLIASWLGVRDRESGLCESTLANSQGWIFSRSLIRNSLKLDFPMNSDSTTTATIYDCFGNGIRLSIKARASEVDLNSSNLSKIGNWRFPDATSSKRSCIGDCAITIDVLGSTVINLSRGKAKVFLEKKFMGFVNARAPFSLKIGSTDKSLRIVGSNFTLDSIAVLSTSISQPKLVNRTVTSIDISRGDEKQMGLSRMGFRSSDFLDDWKVQLRPRDTTLVDPTLDFCGAEYSSESERVARRRVIVTKRDSPAGIVSSEVVRYSNATAARNAFSELESVLNRCKLEQGEVSPTGVLIPYNFHRVTRVPGLLKLENKHVLINATFGMVGEESQLLAIYQYKDARFTALNVTRRGADRFTDDEVENWLKVASVLAARM
jgi:hypothetical protein